MCAVELIIVKVWRIFPCTARVWSSKVKKNINIDSKHLIENHMYHRGFAPHVRYVSYLKICLSHSCRALLRQLTIFSSAVSHPGGFAIVFCPQVLDHCEAHLVKLSFPCFWVMRPKQKERKRLIVDPLFQLHRL